MAYIFKKCPNCTNILTIFSESKTTSCEVCGAEFENSSILHYKDIVFFKNFSESDFEKSLKYNALIIQGNENISNSLYQKAEECFKQAIELDENRYEGYYGVTKAKTQDFQVLPDNNDYLEYAKIAMSLADDDVDHKINANLAKLNIFKP